MFGCEKHFCFEHLSEHRTNIAQRFDQLQNDHDQIRQQINDLKMKLTKYSSIKQIDQWEEDSIQKIRQHAQRCRTQFMKYSNSFIQQIEQKLIHLAQQIKEIQQEMHSMKLI